MVTQEEYENYKNKHLGIINNILSDMGCRPVLFIGSGMSSRYIGGPDWIGLLKQVSDRIGIDEKEFNFISQKSNNNPIKIGSLLSDKVHEWAFGVGQNSFPQEYFNAKVDKDIFIKHIVCDIMNGLLDNEKNLDVVTSEELKSFKSVGPHAVITTNFDTFLERCFPDFEVISGEKIIPFSLNIMGEMYKVHGTADDPHGIVLTEADYQRFSKKRKYISSKIMTYFAEYPLFIFGYRLGDENINNILSDLGEALKDNGGLLENVFLVRRIGDLDQVASLQEEHAVAIDGETTSIRVRTIMTQDFKWIFDALGNTENPIPVPVKTLRHLASKVVDLVRVDVPKNRIEIDFVQIKKLSEDSSELAKVLGIANVQNPNFDYPYSLTDIGKKLGYNGWHGANDLLKIANEQLGYDIKTIDNEYHMAFKVGQSSNPYHKYSEAAFDLLAQIRDQLKASEGI